MSSLVPKGQVLSADLRRAGAASLPALPSPPVRGVCPPDYSRYCEASENYYFSHGGQLSPNPTPFKTRENGPHQQGSFHFTSKRVSKFGADNSGKLIES